MAGLLRAGPRIGEGGSGSGQSVAAIATDICAGGPRVHVRAGRSARARRFAGAGFNGLKIEKLAAARRW